MVASTRTRRGRSGLLLALGLAVAAALFTGPAAGPAMAAERGLAAWTGGVNLYRSGTFTTQRSWLWCTAAGVQIVRNIVERDEDHSTSAQRRYFAWMRERNRYDLPLSAGVDPEGWTAGLRRFVDSRYRLVSSRTFDGALRSAVKRLRLTGLPVALAVSRGNHGWILTGFRATADPARTAAFEVTSVRVVGPLYGLQSENGYDMPPNTKLTTTELRRFFTPWRYAPKRMIWDGRYVSIQPVPTATGSTGAAQGEPEPTPTPSARVTPEPTPRPSAFAPPSAAPGLASPAGPVAVVAGQPTPTGDAAAALSPASTPASLDPPLLGLAIVLVLTGLLVATAITVRRETHLRWP